MLNFKDLENVSLTHKNILITGANSGLGFESAKYFAAKEARVFLAARNLDKANKAKAQILVDYPHSAIDVIPLDLASFASIDEAVRTMMIKVDHLDILLNNAGLMAIPYQTTQEGFEMQMGVNHLGHMRLTLGLLPLMSEGSRIVNVSSMAYLQGRLDFNNMLYEKGGYSAFGSYGRSKLANLLFTQGLIDELKRQNRSILVTSAHPGVAKTNLFDPSKQPSLFARTLNAFSFLLPSAAAGAKAQIMACLDPDAVSGYFYGPVDAKRYDGNRIRLEKLNAHASDAALAQQFWTWSSNQLNLAG